MSNHFEERDKVVALFLKGKQAAAISRETGIVRKDVNAYISQFHAYAKDNELLQERGRQVVQEFDHQQDRLIEELWKAVDESDNAGDYKTKGVLLKTLHDIQKGRVDTMQKAGMLSDAAMGDELAAMEEKHEILIQILRDVSASCNKCKMEVARKLARVTGKPEPMVVIEDE
jgi:uncharacterized protein with ATP-grasp and redox domains